MQESHPSHIHDCIVFHSEFTRRSSYLNPSPVAQNETAEGPASKACTRHTDTVRIYGTLSSKHEIMSQSEAHKEATSASIRTRETRRAPHQHLVIRRTVRSHVPQLSTELFGQQITPGLGVFVDMLVYERFEDSFQLFGPATVS